MSDQNFEQLANGTRYAAPWPTTPPRALAARLHSLLHSTDYKRSDEILREPKIAHHLLALVNSFLQQNDPARGPTRRFIARRRNELLQKAVRRNPIDECPELPPLLLALRAACNLGIKPVATQLALAAAVRMLRSDAPNLLESLTSTLDDRATTVLLLTVLAEELHAPASKTSVSPMRLLETRSALRNAGGSVLTSLYQWMTTPSGSSPGSMTPLQAVDALRCAAAWCNAGLLRAEVVGQSTAPLHRRLLEFGAWQ